MSRTFGRHPAAIEIDLAGIGLGDAGQDGDQRRLAGAVLAQKGVNFTRRHFQMDPGQSLHARVAFAQTADAKARRLTVVHQ